MIEIKPGRYFSQWWFLCSDEKKFDVLGALYRDKNEIVWHLVYRFRYYDGTDRGPFDDEDEKRWYRAQIQGSEETALASSNTVFSMLADVAGLTLHVLPTRTDDVGKITDTLRREKWAHSRVYPPTEVKK